eukprot:TRINITY_DN130_c0_g1_i2.p1 TRINITY_DN130_c0_g1~~TRINITY_DN130_c0_g1_i2.p1  ORF type:complete len:111 (-),score=18.00 TRINITY_DN130_c0_g1_i2:40-372(-)
MNQKQQNYLLFLKISKGETLEVQKIFNQHNLHPETRLNAYQWTPIHTAAYKGHLELTKFFLERGSRAHIPNQSGQTPLMLAQRNGNIQICLLYTSPSPRDRQKSRMPSSA